MTPSNISSVNQVFRKKGHNRWDNLETIEELFRMRLDLKCFISGILLGLEGIYNVLSPFSERLIYSVHVFLTELFKQYDKHLG